MIGTKAIEAVFVYGTLNERPIDKDERCPLLTTYSPLNQPDT